MKSTHRQIENWTGHRDPVVRPALILLAVCAIAAGILLLTGCTLTVSPDGTRAYAADPDAFIRAVTIIAEK